MTTQYERLRAPLTIRRHKSSPVAKAGARLFTVPALALAMFRAVGPHYYALDIGGNMLVKPNRRPCGTC